MDNPNIDSAGVDAGAKIFVGLMKAVFPATEETGTICSVGMSRNLSAILRPRPWFDAGENFRPTRRILARSSSAKTVTDPASEDILRIRFEEHGEESRAELSGRITIRFVP
jgi:hypothetical protein